MSGVFIQPPGATPITPDEMRQLIPAHIAFRHELNEAERANIAQAQHWALNRRHDLLTEKFLKTLHKRMFENVWRWAGRFRVSPRNLGIDHWLIATELRNLLDDAKAWTEFQTYPHDEIAVRLHHRLVSIHPFPNGNGRHARLVADVLALQLGNRTFSWGRESLHSPSATRQRYIDALQSADHHDIEPLLHFART